MLSKSLSGLTLIVVGLFCLNTQVSAQNSDFGVWSAFAAQGSIGDPAMGSKWRWWFDGHARFFDDSDGFETSIVRPGIGYKLSDNFTAWLGYAWIHNDTPTDTFSEHRIWQQTTWSETYDWGTPFLRTRLEQRFDDRDSDLGWRVRQFARWTKRLGEGSRWTFRLWDEAFFDLNETSWGQDPGLSQNRAFIGFGWDLDDTGNHTLEFGYLNQFIPRDGGRDSINHIFGVTLISNF